jgi:hypothetical protein
MGSHDQTIAGLEALTRLIEIAQRDTGQSRLSFPRSFGTSLDAWIVPGEGWVKRSE